MFGHIFVWFGAVLADPDGSLYEHERTLTSNNQQWDDGIWCKDIIIVFILAQVFEPTIGKNWQLVTDELVEFEK